MEALLDKIIAMHQEHMDNPETATPESQEEMMRMLQEHKSAMHEGKPMPMSMNQGNRMEKKAFLNRAVSSNPGMAPRPAPY